jgi:hypothetical protein
VLNRPYTNNHSNNQLAKKSPWPTLQWKGITHEQHTGTVG